MICVLLVAVFALLAKVLPLQLTGEGGEAVQTVSRVEIVPVIAKDKVPEKENNTVLKERGS
ncbi:hypothetical protein [Bartonella jaculi]|uniref:Uncharacterized protein n=1 Tax=Bartonella jaculi TaxID=686226 RepID=A0ABP9N3B3_9HYPH